MSVNFFSKSLKHASKDIPAGFVVFLVALPLCLGIALASDAPMASGVVSGIVAGIIVSWISGSSISVSGPTAGLTMTVATAVQRLGSFNGLLVSVLLAGVFQIILGTLRAGVLASFFPHSVMKGTLAAIGLIIILKQIPHALGWDADFVGDEQYRQTADHETTFSEIIKAFDRFELGAIVVSVVTVLSLVAWSRGPVKRHPVLSLVPAPLVAVILGTQASRIWNYLVPELGLTGAGGHLVAIPTSGGALGIFTSLPAPDWSCLSKSVTWEIAITIAIIASIESLLSLEASDRLDPERRVSDSNRELVAQGAGNVICGLIGGLPMAAVIVRSSTNAYAGGRTRLSSFAHGVFLFAAVALVPGMLNTIPLSALAVVLIAVGLKLFSWKLLKQMWRSGFEQALPFAVTLVAIVATDLLTGVAIGLVFGLMIVVRMNHQSAITVVSEESTYLVRFAKDVSFAHKPSLKKILGQLPEGSDVIIDGTGAHFIDHDILETVSDFYEGAGQRNVRVTLKNLRSKRMSKWGGVLHGKLQEPSIGQ